MKSTTGSTAGTLAACPASVVLPQHEAWSDQADHGTAKHDVITAFVNRRPGSKENLRKAHPALDAKLTHILDGVGHISAEEAYVVDVERRTSMYLGKEINREYAKHLGRPLRPYEIAVSLDLKGRTAKSLFIRDWKFGRYSSWWQLYVQGMAVLWNNSSATPIDMSIDAGFIHILDSHDEDGDEELDVMEDAATLYISDLDDRADELLAALRRAEAMEIEVAKGAPLTSLKTVEGKHCQYCGAYPHCPSKWKLAKSMLELDISGSIAALTREQCGSAWKKLGEIEKNIIKKTKDALKDRMRQEGGFPLENGKMLRVIQQEGRKSLNVEAALSLLKYKGCTEIEIKQLFKQGSGYDTVRETKK